MSLKESLEKNESFILRFRTFMEIHESLNEIFGTASATILYMAAIKVGRQSCIRRLKATKSKEEVLKLLVEDKASQNWGDITFENLDLTNCSGKIMVKNCFESRVPRSKNSNCYFFKGYLTGFFTELLQRKISLSEDKCVLKGDSQCEFTLKADQQ